MFSVFEHVTPDLVPAVGVYVGDGLSVAVSGQNGADVYNAMGRITGAKPVFWRGWVNHVKLGEWLEQAGIVAPYKYADKSTRIEPGGRYLKMMQAGLDPYEAQHQAYADPLDGIYFGVGGPISRANQSGNRDVSFVILEEWNR